MNDLLKSQRLLKELQGNSYLFGMDLARELPESFFPKGKRIALIRSTYPGSDQQLAPIQQLLEKYNQIISIIPGPRPNTPLEDLERITNQLRESGPSHLVSFGGGSTIDSTKAAGVLYSLGGTIQDYFGTSLVTRACEQKNRSLVPHLAIQTAASSAAHLTKYANITNLETHQKKLIVDDAIIPQQALFDYETTITAPIHLTIDGALDGFSHALEVYYGSGQSPAKDQTETVCLEAIRLIIHNLPLVIQHPDDKQARTGLALGTDLGGMAIMLGGTNGGHLTSFSLVDILSHGRACAILNPYYTVYFARLISPQLQQLAHLFAAEGLADAAIPSDPQGTGLHVATAMQTFMRQVNVPTSLKEIPGFSYSHIERALSAAKDPQLQMKLNNMPVPFSAETVDTEMKTLLLAAAEGNLNWINSQI